MNVLIIDDDVFTKKVLSFFLLGLGHSITIAGDGLEAMRIVEKNPDFDMIFCDIMMPGLTGPTFLLLLKKHYPDVLPVISVISGMKDGEAFLKKLEVTYDHFIKKPLEPDQLQQMMREASAVKAY
jgi:CheY-like chemotaxis protein